MGRAVVMVCVVASLLQSCDNSAPAAPGELTIEPTEGANDRQTVVSIAGSFFTSQWHVNFGSPEDTRVDRKISARLGEQELLEVSVLAEGQIRAVVPAGLDADRRYDLTVVDANRQSSRLPEAFLVTPPILCGDGRISIPIERCDDGNTDADDGCSDTCQEEPGWICIGEPSDCQM